MFKKALLAVLIFPLVAVSQQTLKGTFAPEGGYQFGILYRIAPENVLYITDSNIDAKGSFELTMKEDLTPGMYRLVYNLPQDQHFFDFIFSGNEAIEFTFSAAGDVVFTLSEENKLWTSFYAEMTTQESEILKIIATEDSDEGALKHAVKAQSKWYKEVSNASKNMFVHPFITALKPYTADDFKTIAQYKQKAKQDYLAQFDFSNTLLQNSALALERAIKYVYNFTDVADKIQSRKDNMDELLVSLERTTPEYKKMLLANFWGFLQQNAQGLQANYVAETYLIPLAETLQDTALVEKLSLFKNTSVGAKAPNFSWPEYDGDTETKKTLHQLEGAEKYIIAFWSSLCSHCLKEIPLLHDKITALKAGKYKVIAVGLEDFEAEWSPKAANFPQFINVLGLGKWENTIGNRYGVTGTPTYYVLDADKTIVTKPETLEALFDGIDGGEGIEE